MRGISLINLKTRVSNNTEKSRTNRRTSREREGLLFVLEVDYSRGGEGDEQRVIDSQKLAK